MIKKQLSIILIISMTSILLNSVIFPSFTYSSELKSRLKEFTIGGISIGDSVKKIKAKNYICNRIFTSGDDTYYFECKDGKVTELQKHFLIVKLGNSIPDYIGDYSHVTNAIAKKVEEELGISLNKKYSKIHAGNYVRGGKAAGYFGVIDVTEFEFREQGVWIEIFVSNTGDHVARLVIKLDPKTDIKF